MKPYNQSLKFFHTFKINLFAKKIIIVKNKTSLIKIWKTCKKRNIKFILLGEGSNVLFLKNYNGIVAINKITGITIEEQKKHWLLNVKGGVKWHSLIKYTMQKKIYGLENLALIPGSVGSAPIQNIGAYGIEFKDICDYVDLLSLNNSKIIRVYKNECCFNYRNSIFTKKYNHNHIIYSVGIKLSKNWIPNLSYLKFNSPHYKNNITPQKIFYQICKIRKKKLPNPNKIGNAGSFFKNPIVNSKYAKKLIQQYHNLPYYPQKNGTIKLSAGWLINQCRLKKLSIGYARIYKKNSLVLINKNNLATANEIITLANIIVYYVKKKFDIILKPEVNIIK